MRRDFLYIGFMVSLVALHEDTGGAHFHKVGERHIYQGIAAVRHCPMDPRDMIRRLIYGNTFRTLSLHLVSDIDRILLS